MAIHFNPQQLLSDIDAGRSAAAAEQMLVVLRHFEQERIEASSDELIRLIQMIVQLFVHAIASDRFIMPDGLTPEFIRHNATFANMVRLSSMGTADPAIQTLLDKPNNLAKLLFLYSPYSQIMLDIGAFFSANPYLASLWVASQLKHRWQAAAQTRAFLERVLSHPAMEKFTIADPRYPLVEEPCFAFFDATYASQSHERAFRDIINAQVQAHFPYRYQNLVPDDRRILIISAFLYQGHSVYRCLTPLLASLRPHYHVALFYLGVEHHDKLDHALFDEIHTMGVKDYSASFTYEMLEAILKRNYGIVLLPDIGLSRPSLILSNMRLAPIQITTYGHPVTSGKSQIDYFIGGRDLEPKDNPKKHFEEPLVLMPGVGSEPVRPDYTPTFPTLADDVIEIGLSWGEMKFTYEHLVRLKTIQERAKRRVRYVVLGISSTHFTYLVAKRDLEAMFGADGVRVLPSMSATDYMRALERCHLLLDSHHYGGYNRVVDALVCRKPMITLMGEKSYNRLAGALLRQCGLSELVAETPKAFIETALRWIDDDAFRSAIAKKLAALDLDAAVFQSGNERYFKEAVDTIVAHHHGRPNPHPAITVVE